MYRHLFRTLLTLALASGCTDTHDDFDDETESSDTGDFVDRACDPQGRCFVRLPDWTAWAHTAPDLSEALAHRILVPAAPLGDAQCYSLFSPGSPQQYCTIYADGELLIGVPVGALDYNDEVLACAEIAPPWYSAPLGESGDCYGIVGPIAVLLRTEYPG